MDAEVAVLEILVEGGLRAGCDVGYYQIGAAHGGGERSVRAGVGAIGFFDEETNRLAVQDDPVVALLVLDGVVAVARVDVVGVVAVAAVYGVVAGAAVKDVVAAQSDEQVVAAPAVEGVVAVVAIPADEQVIVRAGAVDVVLA